MPNLRRRKVVDRLAAKRPAPSTTASSASRCLHDTVASVASSQSAEKHLSPWQRFGLRGAYPCAGDCRKNEFPPLLLDRSSGLHCSKHVRNVMGTWDLTLKWTLGHAGVLKHAEPHLSSVLPPRASERAACTAGTRDPPPSSSTAFRSAPDLPTRLLRSKIACSGLAAAVKNPPAKRSKSALHPCLRK